MKREVARTGRGWVTKGMLALEEKGLEGSDTALSSHAGEKIKFVV